MHDYASLADKVRALAQQHLLELILDWNDADITAILLQAADALDAAQGVQAAAQGALWAFEGNGCTDEDFPEQAALREALRR